MRYRFPARFGSLLAVVLLSSPASAQIFFTTQGSFNAGLGGNTLMGTENWSSGTATSFATFNDSLQPGIANGPFPGGTSVASGITVQSNTLANPATLSPRGINGLTFAPTGTAGVSGNLQPSNQLSSNSNGDSFDIRFSVALGMVPRAVDLSPMYYRVGSANNTGTLTIRVFDSNNVLQGTTTVANVGDCLENGYIGIVLPTNLVLGRVNVSTGGTTDVSGADNIRVFGTPVPEPVGILGVIGIAAAIGRRQRPSCRSAV